MIKKRTLGAQISRWESDGGSDASAAHLVREGEGVVTRAGRAAERILLNVLFAAMAELLLAALAGTKHWISDNHTEPLWYALSIAILF